MNQPELDKYQPGTTLTVGSHSIQIIKYLTSGGFAQIYSCQLSKPDDYIHQNFACVKRVIVPDKGSLNVLRAEVEAMKLLRNNAHVVSYIDSHAAKSNFHNGSYEVFLLMEYCGKGGLIDFMNTRLQNRLQEFEVLNIILQITQGVAAMHALNPPLIHRDLKIENVLISSDNQYKVCDFGSVSGIIRPPITQQEMAYVQHDIMKNTTAQYRSPEMIDLYRHLPIDEKSDIWALGVLLYKLCYYTTPFEKGGENAILYSRYDFPQYPQYSENLKNFIRWMLLVNPQQRPNIYQVAERASQLLGVPCPIIDFYSMDNNSIAGQLAHVASLSQLNMMTQGISTPNLLQQQQQLQQQQMAMQMQPQQFMAQPQMQPMKTSQSYAPSSNELNNKLTQVRTVESLPASMIHKSKTSSSYVDETVQTTDESPPPPQLHPTKSQPNIASEIILSSVSTSSSDEDEILKTINLPPRRKISNRIYSKQLDLSTDSETHKNELALEKKIKDAIEASKKEYEDNKEILESSMIDERKSLFDDENKVEEIHNDDENVVDDIASPSITQSVKKFEKVTIKDTPPAPPPARTPQETPTQEKKPSKLTEEQKLQNKKTKEMLRQKMKDKLNQSGKNFVKRNTQEERKQPIPSNNTTSKPKTKPLVPVKPDRLKPKKPKKPSFLAGNVIANKV